MTFFERRRIQKTGKDILRYARHVRSMREDILAPAELARLGQSTSALRVALKSGSADAIEAAGNDLYAHANRVAPAGRFAGFRENLEILIVAVAVAMAFRAYFVQPFKIPTGSMQPTLYGIHSTARTEPGLFDRLPLKLVKWLVWGQWYREVVVNVPGQLSQPGAAGADSPSVLYYYVGSVRYELPKDAELNFKGHDYVPAGSVLWSGVVTAGDHVFVDKVRWNFSRPKRGGIMVFKTDGIAMLMQGTHYIKRMAGTPGDEINISTPYLIVNGKELMDPEPVAKISRREPPYDKPPYGHGYIPPILPGTGGHLKTPMEVMRLEEHQYLGLGDNTANSFDGRYWGPVPESNLVGPACLVYWPFSERWGRAR